MCLIVYHRHLSMPVRAKNLVFLVAVHRSQTEDEEDDEEELMRGEEKEEK